MVLSKEYYKQMARNSLRKEKRCLRCGSPLTFEPHGGSRISEWKEHKSCSNPKCIDCSRSWKKVSATVHSEQGMDVVVEYEGFMPEEGGDVNDL